VTEHRSSWERTATAWRWPLVLLAMVIVIAVLAIRVCRVAEEAPERTVDAVRGLADDVAGIAERFRSGTITTTFLADVPRLVEDEGLKLEVAAFEATETFTRTDERSVAWELVPLGTATAEIKVPVTYRYHVRLDEEWRLEVNDHTCVVHAPPIRATLPPAIHTEGMVKSLETSGVRWDGEEVMNELERYLTPRLSARARSPERIDLVRETCRRRVAEFVRGWLLREDHWRSDRFRAVTVVFADEAPADPAPTLVLEPTD
jgi:hypothetical protein